MLESLRRRSSSPVNLLDIIGEVRTRWRTKLALRGALAVAGIGFGLFLLAAYGMEWARFSGASIIAARVAMLVVLAASAYWFLWLPLRRRVSDEQVAMYLEEHEPSLQATLLSAVETSQGGHIPESAALVRRVVEQAIDACMRSDASRRVEQQPLRRYAAALGGIALVALLALALGPAFLRNAMSAMLLLSSDVEAASPYRIEVKPGNADRTEGRRPDDYRQAARVRFRGRDAARAAHDGRSVRIAAAGSQRERRATRACFSTSTRTSHTRSSATGCSHRNTS